MTGEQILCRLCLSSKGLILPIFNGVVAEKFAIPLPVKIMSCLSIEVSSGDILPTLICYRCLYEIDRFHEFKAACVKVDTILQECVTSDSNLIVTETLNIKEEILSPIEYCTTTHDAPVHASSASNSPRDVEETIVGIPEVDDYSSAESLEVLASKYDESVVPCRIRNASDTCFPESDILAFVTATDANANPSHYEEIICCTVTDENAEPTYHLSLEDEALPISIVNDGGISSPSKEMVSLPTIVTEGISSSQSNKKNHEVEIEINTNTSRNNTLSYEIVNGDQFYFKTFDSDTFKKHEKIKSNKSEVIKDKVEILFSCKNCPGTYKTQRNLHRHEKYYCRLLSKETKEKFKAERLKKKPTVLSVPNTDVQLPVCCRFCLKSFTVKRRWIRHEKYWCPLNPNKVKRRINCYCKICNESFEHPRALMHHNQINISTHGLQCRFCSKTYFKQIFLERHESIHLGSKPYNCRVCKKAFSDRSNCIAHEKIHKNEKSFLCSTCGKAFMFKKGLRNHEFLHTGIRDVKCELCPKTFADKCNLRSHYKYVHSTLRKYCCPNCERSFLNNSKLQKHLKVHSGERPYRLPKHKRKCPENVKESDPSTNKD